MHTTGAPRIVIIGGGYVGLYCARRLERELDRGEADLLLINPTNYMVYQPLLPEVASETLEARQAVVPLRQALRRTHVNRGRVTHIDAEGRTITFDQAGADPIDVAYDHLVVGLGAQSKIPPVPGLAEHAVGFQTIAEALRLRHQVIEGLETAEAAPDAHTRRQALTFVVVGGGYTGVEAIAELEDLARDACRRYPTVTADEIRWVLVEATDRLLPTVEPELAERALHELRARGIEVRLDTTVSSVAADEVELSDGERVPTHTVAWVAGVEPNPVVASSNVPTDEQGRIPVDRELRVGDAEGIWAAGDIAAVPDGHGGLFPPTAQHAQRQGDHVGANLAATLRGKQPRPFEFSSPGEMISLGHRKGVASLYGRQLRGVLPWLLRRAYHAALIPTVERKLRIAIEWSIGVGCRRDALSLEPVERPHEPLHAAARSSAEDDR